MIYREWIENYGANRWYKDDIARTLYPLDYNWSPIFEKVTSQCDLFLDSYELPNDIETFTDNFLGSVAENWLLYKVQLENMSGTLDGTTIDPTTFTAGHEMNRTHTENINNVTGSNSSSENEIYSTSNSTSDVVNVENSSNKDRTFLQGVQENEFISDDKNASNIVDVASERSANNNNTTNANDNSNGLVKNSGTANSASDVVTTDYEKVTRVNYYDQLAFNVGRFDRMENFKSFASYFIPLFTRVHTMKGNF